MRVYYENYDYNISVWEEENFNFSSAHWHTKVELTFVLEGSIYVGVNNEKRLMKKGEAVILGSGDIHYYDGREHSAKVLILIFKPELINCFAGWPDNKQFISNFLSKDLLNSSGLKELIELTYMIKSELDNISEYSDMFFKAYLYKLCGVLMRECSTTATRKHSTDKVLVKLKMLQEIFTYIERNYMNNLTLVSVAKQFNLSPKHFSKLFNSVNSLNFRTHLNMIRVNSAEGMIYSSKLPLIEIAYECGFNSIRTFNRAFKEIKGYVPSDLRNKFSGSHKSYEF